jgi:hypothetical protein
VIHLASGEQLHHLHERHLHRIRILKQRHEKRLLPELIAHNPVMLLSRPLMKKALPPSAQRRRPALHPIHPDMLTPSNIS